MLCLISISCIMRDGHKDIFNMSNMHNDIFNMIDVHKNIYNIIHVEMHDDNGNMINNSWWKFWSKPWKTTGKKKRQYHEGDLYPGGRAFHWRLGLWRPPQCGARLSVTVGRPPLRTDFDQSQLPSFCRTKTVEMKKKNLGNIHFQFYWSSTKGKESWLFIFFNLLILFKMKRRWSKTIQTIIF